MLFRCLLVSHRSCGTLNKRRNWRMSRERGKKELAEGIGRVQGLEWCREGKGSLGGSGR
jgi:hypothetical protein